MYQLRDYQQSAVNATVAHFKQENTPAVIVLPTGAGKSLVIAELARIARGRVLILAHVKELVQQNHAKYVSLNLKAGIFSAGLDRKDSMEKVIFGSIQSVARADDNFFKDFSLLIIDECHRISTNDDTQYFQVITKLKNDNNSLCILGLTATPYRLGTGWIYQLNVTNKMIQTSEDRFFKKCIFELSLKFMIKNKYLTPPVKIDSPVACYDFTSLKQNGISFVLKEIENLLKDQARITPVIIQNIIDMSKTRDGVMIFTSSVKHAEEILKCLPDSNSALIVGDTDDKIRDAIINDFKNKKIKFLVNVSVLTTGFDAPHVDVIAILRPTESVSLYQQIVGRGLRLSPNKFDCLILDYTGQGHDIFSPEITDDKPNNSSVMVDVTCPACGLINNFWGILDAEGILEEHYGRKCKGAIEMPLEKKYIECGYRFRFKRCDKCNHENDTAARSCQACQHLLVDNDKKLKEAMSLKDAHVMKVETMLFYKTAGKNGAERLEIHYYDVDGEALKEYYYLNSPEHFTAFYFNFSRMHNRIPEKEISISSINDAIDSISKYRIPLYIIARKKGHYWEIREKIF
jgi:DNA repair protein RadD